MYYLFKIIGLPYNWFYFKRKVYFLNKTKQKRKVRGPIIFVSNYHSNKDYTSLYFLYYFKKIVPIVGDDAFKNGRFKAHILKRAGALNINDPECWLKAEKLLKKGKKIVVYPDSFPFEKRNDFSYIKIARALNIPLLPIYSDGHYSFKRRNHMMIGTPIFVESEDETDLLAANESINSMLKKMGELTEKRSKTPVFSFKFLFWDYGRFIVYSHLNIYYRVKVHDYGITHKFSKIDGPIILASSHSSFADPVVLISTFWRRRVQMLIAEAVYNNHKVMSFGLNGLGGIKISRGENDLKALSKCNNALNFGRALLIFPEGHINRDDDLKNFKNGTSMISARTKTPVLPIYIKPRKHWYHRYHVYVGEMIEPPLFNINAINEHGDIVRLKINELKKEAETEIKK